MIKIQAHICDLCLMQVLGALITHMGSGVNFEVSSALETLSLLASKYAPELIPLSSHINGISSTCFINICFLSVLDMYVLPFRDFGLLGGF